MKYAKLFIVTALISVLFASRASAEDKFRYDSNSGKCLNSQGKTGYNLPNPEALFSNPERYNYYDPTNRKLTYPDRDAECVNFENFDFNIYIGLQYNVLERWNLRGANLSNSKFFFANLEYSDLSGADLENFDFGYSIILGAVIDAHTKVPQIENAICQKSIHMLYCRR